MPLLDVCIKCGNNFTEREKEIGIPLCQKCICLLTEIVKKKIRKSDENNMGQDIYDFSTFILSSGKLFKLDNMSVIQCCFNIFMSESKKLGGSISQNILRDALKFIEKELENIIDNDRTFSNNNDPILIIDKLIKNGMKDGADNSAIDEIERYIDSGISERKDEDSKKGYKRKDSKDEDKNQNKT
jgi:hypothetical protein